MLQLPEDGKLAAARERKRRQEEERKLRIFNRRSLVMGVDRDALARQVQERKEREDRERQWDKMYDEQRLRDDRIAVLVNVIAQEEKRELNKEVDNFRLIYQRRDPDPLDKAQVMDQPLFESLESKLGTAESRSEHGKKQMRCWLEQQVKEKAELRKTMQAAEAAAAAALWARDSRAVQLDAMEQELKRKMFEATQLYNRALSDEAESRAHLHRQLEDEMNATEIANALTGDLLADMERITPAEIRAQQLLQAEERKIAAEEERSFQEAWTKQNRMVALCGELQELEIKEERRRIGEEVAMENRRLAEKQAAMWRHMEKEVYTNQPTADYHSQFNASTR